MHIHPTGVVGGYMKADKKQITTLLKTANGQINGILKMIEEDRYCIDISTQLMATIAILKKANFEILNAHLHGCLASIEPQKQQELADVLSKLMK